MPAGGIELLARLMSVVTACSIVVMSSCTALDGSSPPLPASGSPAASASRAPSLPPSPSPAAPAEVRVAFVQDLLTEGAAERVLEPFRGAELAFAAAALEGDTPVAVDMLAFDIAGDPEGGASIAREIAADPGYVAAIVAPGTGGQAELLGALWRAGVPVLSLSARDPAVALGSVGVWRRFVPTLPEQARALGEVIGELRQSRRGVCLLDDPAEPSALLRLLRRNLPSPDTIRLLVEPEAAAQRVGRIGCGVAVWGGSGEGGARVAVGLREVGLGRLPFLGDDLLQDPAFTRDAGPAAEGAVAMCACADLSTSTDLASQLFIQDFQARFGLPPGAFAVEGWDAARLVLEALRGSGVSREGVASWLERERVFEGLSGRAVFDEVGELVDPAPRIRLYRVEGGRWILLEGRDSAKQKGGLGT